MRNFFVGLAIGVPVGMLLGDHWNEIEPRLRRIVRRDLRGVSATDGDRVAAAVNRVAERAREAAGSRNESSMEEAALNQVTREELLAVYGIGPVMAQRILDGRPYGNDREVVERGILNEQTFDELRRQVLTQRRRSA
jgi:DNA uptake protein ComE-like DNA-binding protein